MIRRSNLKVRRKKRFIWVFLFAFLIFIYVSCKKQATEESSQEILSESSRILKEVEDEYWKVGLEESLHLRMKYGLPLEKLPDLSYEKAQQGSQWFKSLHDKLKSIKALELSHEEWISWETLKYSFENRVEGLQYYWFNSLLTPYATPIFGVHQAFTDYNFKGNEDLKSYLSLLKQYPDFIGGIRLKLEGQYERDIVLPKDEIKIVLPLLNAFLNAGEKSIFYVRNERLSAIEEERKQEFQQQLLDLINSEIVPALKDLIEYVKNEYAQKAPDSVGLWQYPGGGEYYDYLIKVQTTLDYTAEEIHNIGLKHIDIDNQKVEEIKEKVGFRGSLAEFKHFLKTDSQFFAKTADEIGEKLRSFMKGMEQKIDDYFLKKPKTPCGVKRLEPELEGSLTFGHYRAATPSNPKGFYCYNGSNPGERTLLQAESLIYHELIPGHHLHSALQAENNELAEWRRESHHGAFNEGWAEYAAWLGLEMGFYQDPYDLCGRYLTDMFFCARLVADTGMNRFKWPRDKAIQFLKENSVFSETQIKTETLRYSVDIPAQALSYKMGSIKMLELRDKAEKALGEKFDIKNFHEAVLGNGSMPLHILEKHIDWYIEQELAEKTP